MVLGQRAKAPSGKWRGLIGYTWYKYHISLHDQPDKVDQTIGGKFLAYSSAVYNVLTCRYETRVEAGRRVRA
jgi:hypothetical protein